MSNDLVEQYFSLRIELNKELNIKEGYKIFLHKSQWFWWDSDVRWSDECITIEKSSDAKYGKYLESITITDKYSVFFDWTDRVYIIFYTDKEVDMSGEYEEAFKDVLLD